MCKLILGGSCNKSDNHHMCMWTRKTHPLECVNVCHLIMLSVSIRVSVYNFSHRFEYRNRSVWFHSFKLCSQSHTHVQTSHFYAIPMERHKTIRNDKKGNDRRIFLCIKWISSLRNKRIRISNIFLCLFIVFTQSLNWPFSYAHHIWYLTSKSDSFANLATVNSTMAVTL